MFTRRLVGGFCESPDEFLEDVAHLDVVHDIGMEVDLGEPAEDEVEQVRFIEAVDLVAELELVEEDLSGVGGEPGDEVGQVGGDLVLIGEQGDVPLALGRSVGSKTNRLVL